jgi:competence protein ComEC
MTDMNILRYIPGFRSNVRWKKIIAVLYYLLVLLIFTSSWGMGLLFLAAPFVFFSFIGLIQHKKKGLALTKALLPLVLSLAVATVGLANMPDTTPTDTASIQTQENKQEVDSAQKTEPVSETESEKAQPVQKEKSEDQTSTITSAPEQKPQAVAETVKGSALKLHFIDVGQADSILVQTPSGKVMLVDAGNNADGETVVSYLKSQGVKKIDVLVGTHPHEDHVGGMDTVIYAFLVGKIYMPRATTTTKTYEDVVNAITAKGLKIAIAKGGTSIDIDPSIKADILAPNSSSYDDLNNYSVVIKLAYGQTSFMLNGDAEDVSEQEMLAKRYNLKANVLKVGHHGSDSSTTPAFLKAVSPKYAIISVGAGNSYGHPAPETLARLASAGIQVYRTDEAGTIIVTSDGNTIKINKKASPVKPQAPPASSGTASKSSSDSGNKTVVVPVPVPSKEEITPAPVQPSKNDVTVYITDTGDKYHKDGCRYLKKSKIPIKLSEAKAKGYEPCKVCAPPQ